MSRQNAHASSARRVKETDDSMIKAPTRWDDDRAQVVVKKIFIDPTCGDGVCEAPEEYPNFHPAHDSREFIGCKADCGKADQAEVTVNFYDPW